MGVTLLLLALAYLFAMLHHPDGIASSSGGVATPSVNDMRMLRIMHGGMIAGLVFAQFAMSFFWIPLNRRGSLGRLGKLTLSIGTLAFIVAAIFSGFVLPTFLTDSLNDNAKNYDSYRATIQLSFVVNQVFGRLGTVSFGVTALISAVLVLRGSVISKAICISAALSGICLIFLAFMANGLDVKSMTLATTCICVWLGAVGLHLILCDEDKQQSFSM